MSGFDNCLLLLLLSVVMVGGERLHLRRAIAAAPIPNYEQIVNLVQEIKEYGENIHECFHDQYGGKKINPFKQDIRSVLQEFLSHESHNLHEKFLNIRSRVRTVATNLEQLLEHVRDCVKGNLTGQVGITSLALLTPEEAEIRRNNPTFKRYFQEIHLRGPADPDEEECEIPQDSTPIPDTFDWTEKGAITPAKDQGQCGSCFVFSAIATLESAHILKTRLKPNNPNAMLSEQASINCLDNEDLCEQGGLPAQVYKLAKDKGAVKANQEPYVGSVETCRNYPYAFKASRYCSKENNTEEEMQRLIMNYGPIVAGIDASNPRWAFTKDVYEGYCTTDIGHAITVVGWDQDYWIIKNSWGNWWGNNGLFRLARGQNRCGINLFLAQAYL